MPRTAEPPRLLTRRRISRRADVARKIRYDRIPVRVSTVQITVAGRGATAHRMVKIDNVVGSGSLDAEFDLERVAPDIGSTDKCDPDRYPGMYLRFAEDAPLITVYRTGIYIATGADSEKDAHTVRERFLDFLADNEMIAESGDEFKKMRTRYNYSNK